MEEYSITDKIEDLLKERGWSVYKLSKESGIPYSSLNNLFIRHTEPTFGTMRKICEGFHISMSDFFSDVPTSNSGGAFTNTEIELVSNYRRLTHQEQKLLNAYLSGLLRMNYSSEESDFK